MHRPQISKLSLVQGAQYLISKIVMDYTENACVNHDFAYYIPALTCRDESIDTWFQTGTLSGLFNQIEIILEQASIKKNTEVHE